MRLKLYEDAVRAKSRKKATTGLEAGSSASEVDEGSATPRAFLRPGQPSEHS